eukprot:2402879-Amphidinium_carterae.1
MALVRKRRREDSPHKSTPVLACPFGNVLFCRAVGFSSLKDFELFCKVLPVVRPETPHFRVIEVDAQA